MDPNATIARVLHPSSDNEAVLEYWGYYRDWCNRGGWRVETETEQLAMERVEAVLTDITSEVD